MSWSRLDDSWYDHPKLMRLPDAMRNAGAGLRDRALSWSNRHLADGHVPNAVLRTLNCTPQLRASLIEVGLFEDEGQGVYIHDYPEFNETKEELLVRRARAAEIGKLGGLAKKRNAKRQASGTLEALASGTPTNGLAAATEPASGTLQNPATNARPRNARPGPSPIRSSSQAPSAVPARKRPGSPTNEPRLTKAQLDGWSTFGPEWDAFKAAWIGRGLLHPPAGAAQDEAGGVEEGVGHGLTAFRRFPAGLMNLAAGPVFLEFPEPESYGLDGGPNGLDRREIGQPLAFESKNVVGFCTPSKPLVLGDHHAQILVKRPSEAVEKRVMVGAKQQAVADIG